MMCSVPSTGLFSHDSAYRGHGEVMSVQKMGGAGPRPTEVMSVQKMGGAEPRPTEVMSVQKMGGTEPRPTEVMSVAARRSACGPDEVMSVSVLRPIRRGCHEFGVSDDASRMTVAISLRAPVYHSAG